METAPYLEANPGRAVAVGELADVAELSAHRFLGMFKKSLGLTPYQYLPERRVERSKDLIRSKRASLAEATLYGAAIGVSRGSALRTTRRDGSRECCEPDCWF